jgi:superfamily II DNA/RNA helicase
MKVGSTALKKVKKVKSGPTGLISSSDIAITQHSPTITLTKRFMGARVKSSQRESASRRDLARNQQQKVDNENAAIADAANTNKQQEETRSILPHVYTGTGKNRKLVPVGAGNSVYTTEKVPTLSFGGERGDDMYENPILSKEQYQKERRKQEEGLMWEKEAKNITRLKTQLENAKKNKSHNLAKNVLPGIEMTPELIEQGHRLLQEQEEKNKNKKKLEQQKNRKKKITSDDRDDGDLDTDDYDEMFRGDESDQKKSVDDSDGDILAQNDASGRKKKLNQLDPEAIEERLSLKEEELVKKIRMRAFQSHMTITRYCNQNGISHLLPLFEKGANIGDYGDSFQKNGKKFKKNKFGQINGDDDVDDDGDDSEEMDYNKRALDELADLSDNEFDLNSDYNDDVDNYLDIDNYENYSHNDDDNDAAIEIDPNDQKIEKKSKILQKQQQKNTIELGNLARPSIFLQSESSHTNQFNLHSFDQLQQSTSKGLRLNPKKRISRDSDELVSQMNPEEKKSIFIHRTRPSVPDATWTELGINPAISGKLQSLLITNPTATQKVVIPFLIRKYNQRTGRVYVPPSVAIQDYTGSGKTYAYGLPLLSNIDTNITTRMPPPGVVSAIRTLHGVKVANPPPLEAESTPLDEVDPKMRVIQYKDSQIYSNPLGIDPLTNQKISEKDKFLHFGDDFDKEDIVQNDIDTLLSTRGFIDKLSNNADIFNMSQEEWESYVFAQEKREQDEARERKLKPVKRIPAGKVSKPNNSPDQVPDESITGGLTIDASVFNSRVYSLEAIRLRRKKQIRAHLRKIFPFVSTDLLDPDCPQSSLQSIIVVPTKELALQITKELSHANPTVFVSDTALQSSHQLYGDKNFHINPVKGKSPLNIRMATGQIDPILLASLGVFLHKGIDKPNTDAELSPYNQKRAYDANTGNPVAAPKLTPAQKRQHEQDQNAIRPHAFVEFGKNHKFYKEDQEQYRKELRVREKDHVLRVMRLRERQLQGEKLSKFEVGDIESLDAYEAKRLKAEEMGVEFDPEVEYAKTIGFNAGEGFLDSSGEILDIDNDNLLGDGFDYEDDPRKLMEMDDDMLMKKIDLFRTDFTKHKMFKNLSQQDQREFKSRLATIMTKLHLKQQDDQRKEALRKLHEDKFKQGRTNVNFMPKFTFTAEETQVPDVKKQNKDHFMQEVSELLMEQMGGEQGDFVEVVREKQPHVIVGTPTTIVNLIKSGAIQLPSTGLSPNQLKSIVFDECDHLARNETSLEHHSLLELLSLPTDQSVFVSASMTRDNARLLTRLGRRQDLFINNKKPQFETVTDMLTLPRPKYKFIPEDIADQAYQDAFDYAQDKVGQFNMQIEQDPMALNDIVLSSPRAKKDRLKALTNKLEDPNQRGELVGKIVDTMYKQNFSPVIPPELFQKSLQDSISRGKLSFTTTADEYGEVLFLSAEDYKVEAQPSEYQMLTAANPEAIHDVHSLPIPPFVKQYYIAPPRLANITQKLGGKEDVRRLKSNSYLKRVLKDNLALDMICQFKLRPLKQGDGAKVDFTPNAYQKLLDQRSEDQRENFNDVGTFGNELNDRNDLVGHNTFTNFGQKKKISKSHTATSICPGTILVFFNPRREDDMMGLFRQLQETGLKVGLYCGLSDRHQKHEVLTKNEGLDVILTNDSLSRGIDFKNLSMVINVDPPRATTTFIHRSGRVGRVGGKFRKSATVINIVDMVPTNEEEIGHQNSDPNIEPTDTSTHKSSETELNIPKQTATYAFLKHAERTSVTINPWPYVVTHNISRVYLRSLKSIIAQDTEKQGIKRHLDRRRKTEEYVKARNVKLHKQGIIQTRDTGLFDLNPGYSDSSFQPNLGKKSQSVAIHRIQAKVNEKLRGRNGGQPWIQTNEKPGKGGHKTRTIKH